MNIRHATHGSYGSTLIEIFFKSKHGDMVPISYGTGFRIKISEYDFLVTNWHVITNRNPNNYNMTISSGDSPTHIRLHFPSKTNRKHFLPTGFFPLYTKEGNPSWLEHSKGFEWADVVFLPGIFPNDAFFPAIDEFAPQKGTVLEPGLDVCLIGFPFGRNQTNPFPIWKKAMVASEPAYAIDGKPFAYLDTPGRPGMSGSPVYAISDSILVSNDVHHMFAEADAGRISALDVISNIDFDAISDPKNRTKGLEFLGVYAGSLGDQSLDRLNLGRFWPNAILRDIVRDCRNGENPVKPILY